jgi:hypothetical protein
VTETWIEIRVTDMTPEELLAKWDFYELEWVDPFPALGMDGWKETATLRTRATVHDCVNMSRATAKQAGATKEQLENNTRLLDDFIAVHWAQVYNPKVST